MAKLGDIILYYYNKTHLIFFFLNLIHKLWQCNKYSLIVYSPSILIFYLHHIFKKKKNAQRPRNFLCCYFLFFHFFNDLVPKKEIKMNKEFTELVLFATIPKFIFDDKIIKKSYCNDIKGQEVLVHFTQNIIQYYKNSVLSSQRNYSIY